MAYLIAARSLKPPLAIGLFGDWGSGKSFFMEALRKRIHKITEDATKCGMPQKEISVFKSIVQIEFNAWHYVDTNLWASLAIRIFDGLAAQFPRREGDTVPTAYTKVMATVASSTAATAAHTAP